MPVIEFCLYRCWKQNKIVWLCSINDCKYYFVEVYSTLWFQVITYGLYIWRRVKKGQCPVTREFRNILEDDLSNRHVFCNIHLTQLLLYDKVIGRVSKVVCTSLQLQSTLF